MNVYVHPDVFLFFLIVKNLPALLAKLPNYHLGGCALRAKEKNKRKHRKTKENQMVLSIDAKVKNTLYKLVNLFSFVFTSC